MTAATLTHGSRGPLLIALAAIAILGTALASQFFGGLNLCHLCLYQRGPYAFAIPAALLAASLVLSAKDKAAAAIVALCGVAFAIGAGVAAFHVGVEQHWWAGSSACVGAAAGTAQTVDQLRELIAAAPVTRCDAIAWAMLGVSMAGYNLIASVALALFALVTARTLAYR